ncbi:hypothetical protein [Sphingomonas sp. ERG5]|uniref:hypothetical protein n=1 Tax=Sphingomonas sp. ERG5 TaxID=1381597 RepID=UPI00054C6903|nr:hypothetical protein [Sphingomonas sp. ERG5]
MGARVRIKSQHQRDVEALFNEAMIAPIYKEVREDGDVSYWFGKEQMPALIECRVLERILVDHWVHYAVLGSP